MGRIGEPGRSPVGLVAVLGVLLCALVGCGTTSASGSSDGESTGSTPTPERTTASSAAPTTTLTPVSTAPLPRLVHVFGAAVDSTGAPQGGVAVAFVPAVAGVGRRVSAVTSSNGFYSVEVPAGDYLGACLSQAGSCQLRTGAGVAHRLTFSGPSMIVSISVTTAVTPSSSPAQEEPAASFSGTAALPDGSPAAGVVIEFKTLCPGVCQQPFVKTDQDGHYAINLDAGTYNALCVVSNEDYECGPRGGDGGPHPVDVPPQGQHLDFVVCLNDQYPACLAS